MSFARSKRLLLLALAALAPLPLPFNDLLEWPILVAYWVLLGIILARSLRDSSGEERWLPNWAMNLLGLAYLPLLVVDLASALHRQIVAPLIHLALFVLVVKLAALTRERDKWHAFLAIFFLFLAAMGTSVDPTVFLYLVAFLALALLTLSRFALWSVLARFGYHGEPAPEAPIRGFLVVSFVLALLIAVPLFALLPRIPAPFILGRGTGTGTIIHASGFTDEVGLDSVNRVRSSRAVVMRLAYQRPPGEDVEQRFKAASYDLFRDGQWRRSPFKRLLRQTRQGDQNVYQLTQGQAENSVHVVLEPLGSHSLPLPVTAVSVRLDAPGWAGLGEDRGDTYRLTYRPRRILEYDVGLASQPPEEPNGEAPAADSPALDTTGVTARMRQLAARVMGSGTTEVRSRRLERYLMDNYQYSTSFTGHGGGRAVDEFLFETKSGHCEYFASAMVLLLRSQGIPARLVTGFLGAEYNPLEDTYIVRELNAHAWVEAWIGGRGWAEFDPTPAAGRPAAATPGLALFLSQAWDYVQFRWDRYVLTYGFADQLDMFQRLRHLWFGFWHRFTSREASAPGTSGAVEVSQSAGTAVDVGRAHTRAAWIVAIAVFLAALLAVVALLWRATRVDGRRAFERLREILSSRGTPVPPSLPPLAVAARLAAACPEAGGPGGRVVALYLRESFGGQALAADEREDLRRSLRHARRALRRTPSHS